MKAVTVKKISTLPSVKPDDTDSIVRFCYFILTRLISDDKAAICAQWEQRSGMAKWQHSTETDFIFEMPSRTEEVATIASISVFRSILARLGFFLMQETYFGAGTFKVELDGKVSEKLFGVILSNTKETGYWIKLQTIS